MAESDDLIDQFDKKVASLWLLIVLGATESVKLTVILIADHFIQFTVLGMDISAIALFALLSNGSLTLLICVKILERRRESHCPPPSESE